MGSTQSCSVGLKVNKWPICFDQTEMVTEKPLQKKWISTASNGGKIGVYELIFFTGTIHCTGQQARFWPEESCSKRGQYSASWHYITGL